MPLTSFPRRGGVRRAPRCRWVKSSTRRSRRPRIAARQRPRRRLCNLPQRPPPMAPTSMDAAAAAAAAPAAASRPVRVPAKRAADSPEQPSAAAKKAKKGAEKKAEAVAAAAAAATAKAEAKAAAKAAKAAAAAADKVAKKTAAGEQRRLRQLEKEQTAASKKAEKQRIRAQGAREKEQRDAEQARLKAEEKAAAREALRRAPSSQACGVTCTRLNVLALLREEAERLGDGQESYAAAFAPLRVGPPSEELLAFAGLARSTLHDAYGDAKEDYTGAHAVDAGYSVRIQAAGSVVRRRLCDALIELHEQPAPTGLRVAFFRLWAAVYERFAVVSANAVAAPAVFDDPKDAASSDGGEGDRQVCANVAGWVLHSLTSNAAMSQFGPLLDKLKVELPSDPESCGVLEPAVRFVLAKQHFGGLTGVSTSGLNAFALAQAIMSANLTPAHMTEHGPRAYNLAVENTKADSGVRAAFKVWLHCDSNRAASGRCPDGVRYDPVCRRPSCAHPVRASARQGLFADATTPTMRALVDGVIDHMLLKFFNMGAKSHAAQWNAWMDAASGRDGSTALRTKLKVLQVSTRSRRGVRVGSAQSQPCVFALAHSVTGANGRGDQQAGRSHRLQATCDPRQGRSVRVAFHPRARGQAGAVAA